MNEQQSLKHALAEGRKAVVAQVSTPSPLIAEALSAHPWDGILFDLQHGQTELNSLLPLLQAISGRDITPLVRIAWNEPSAVMRVLDAGAAGVICPLVNNRAEAESFVAAASYPPDGIRSFGPFRAGLHLGGAEYAARANHTVMTFAMIETAEAVASLDEIVSTPGLTGIYVGPADLSRALGGEFGVDWAGGPVRAVIDDALTSVRRHGKLAGIYCDSAEYARQMLELGFSYAVVGSDVGYVRAQSTQILEILRPVVENGS